MFKMAQRARGKNLEMAKTTDQRPVNIMEIHKVEGFDTRSKYVSKINALRKLLEPVKNLEVLVIAVVGQSNGGKSFLLNYMLRFLHDYKNSNGWIGNGNEPLQGFDWGLSSESKTSGLWLSQPIVVKQSNGKEIAVLLMDTQSLFDDQFEPRDWSTIMGISLLMSSCLICNVFTDIPEDLMSTLDSYINIGIKDIESNGGAFQTLLFLIRDWNSTNEFKFGMGGGKQYLDKKLINEDNQSPEAKIFRENLKKCFEEVMCFLMPQFGEVKEDFDGSFNKLRDRFREKLKEFISTLLNPEELVPKMIYGTPIIGEELCQLFQLFVDIFNREQLPESHIILDAKNQFYDNVLIRTIKNKHMSQLQAFIHSKPFVTRKVLETQNQNYRSDNIEDFESEMKSKDPSLVDTLCQHLDKNYELALNDNEEQRDHYMEERRDMCCHQFSEALNEELKSNGCVEPEVLEELLKNYTKKFTDYFKEGYGGENEKLFKEYFSELKEFINNSKEATRSQNFRRLKEFEKNKDKDIDIVVGFYSEHMNNMLKDTVYLTKDQYKKEELNVRTKTETKLRKDYDFGKQSTNETFYLKVGQKLNESKQAFKKKYQAYSTSVEEQTKKVILGSVEKYEKGMDERLDFIQTLQDFENSHKKVFSKVYEELQNSVPFKADYFLDPYIEAFNKKTNQLYDTFKTQFTQKIQSRQQKYQTALIESKEHYLQGMSQLMKGNEIISTDELNKNHKKYRKSALKVYERLLEGTDQYDPLFKGFQSDLKDLIDEEFDTISERNEKVIKSDGRQIEALLEQSLDTFHTSMGQIAQNCKSELELSNSFISLKDGLRTDILGNNKVSDKSLLNQKLLEFENYLNQSFNGIKRQFQERKSSVLDDYESKVTRSRDAYKQRMDQFLKTSEFISDEELNECNQMTKSEIISELTKQLKPLFDIKVEGFVERTDQLIGNEHQMYFMANEIKRNQILETIQNSSKVLINEYQNKMSEDLDFIAWEDKLQQKHTQTLQETLRKSRNSCIDFEEKVISLQDNLIENEITKSFEDILETFRENKLQLNGKLEEKAKHIKQSYRKTMDTAFDSMLSEDDLNNKHYEVMAELLEEFNDGLQLADMTLLEESQKELQSFMKSQLTDLQKKLDEKIERIIESYKKLFPILTLNYNLDMDKVIMSEDIISDQEFQRLHEVYSNKAIDSFDEHLRENPSAEGPVFASDFKRDIEKDFNKIKDKFKMKRDLKLKDMELAVTDFGQKYENNMKELLDSVNTKEELGDSHRKIKEKLVSDFRETYKFINPDQIKIFVEKLEANIENFLDDFDTILDFKIENRTTMVKSLKQDIRSYYKKEMETCFQNKQFVPKSVVNENHKLVLKKTIDKFSPEKADFTEGEFRKMTANSVADIFIKIFEDNEMKRPTDSPAIGIDLGTTNSCVAYFKPDSKNPNNVVVIPNEMGHLTTPSVVSYRDNSIISVGEEAKEMIHRFPKNTISSVKRLIGRQYDDEDIQNDMNLWFYKVVDDGNNNPKVILKIDGQDQDYFPEQISAKVLRKMKEIAESHLGCEVTKAVITVPAYFKDGQKEATKDAGKIAGLEVLRIINEPTAAAIAFKVDRNEETETRNVLIFDFGGGTFDVSILTINRGKIEVKAVVGDNHLGGDDIDTSLVKYCLEQFCKEFSVVLEGDKKEEAMCRLRNKCEDHKKRLTEVETTIIEIDNFYQNNDLRVPLTRNKFEELNHHLFEKSIDLVRKVLEEKDIKPSAIDDVVLVGGTTRIPKLQEMLSDFFDGKVLNHWVNPDEAVAKGAAIHAAYLNVKQLDGSCSNELQINDVTPLSLGISIKGDIMSVIVPRNSPVPITFTKQYITSEDYQTTVTIEIFEGEETTATANHLLGKFTMSGIPSALIGEQPIDVTFTLNDEGILKVKAKIVKTGDEENIEITAGEDKGRLTAEKIEQLMSEENSGQTFGQLFK